MYTLMGDDGLKGVDSFAYTSNASDFANALKSGTVHGSQWFGQHAYTMPLYHWLAAIPFLIFGNTYGTLTYVLMQGMFDAGTCIAVYGMASQISARVAVAAALVAVINPTQVVLSGLFYTDTPFIFFVAVSFWAAFCWAENPSWRTALLLGLFLGCAALIRAIIVPWSFFALASLGTYALFRKLALQEIGNNRCRFRCPDRLRRHYCRKERRSVWNCWANTTGRHSSCAVGCPACQGNAGQNALYDELQ